MSLKVYVTLPTARTFYSYIKRVSDGLYYDTDDSTFKAYGSLVDGQIEFTEDSNLTGEYSWELTIADGTYILYTKEDPGHESVAQAQEVVIKFGNEVSTAVVLSSGDSVIETLIVDDPTVASEVDETC